jgi:hypothetical protein
MVTGGTGHDRCPSQLRAHSAPGHHLTGGDKKISKTRFGFKRGKKNFVGRSSKQALCDRHGPAEARAAVMKQAALVWRLKLALQPAHDRIGLQRVRAVTIETLPCASSLAAGRQRQDQEGPAAGASRSFRPAHASNSAASPNLRQFQIGASRSTQASTGRMRTYTNEGVSPV